MPVSIADHLGLSQETLDAAGAFNAILDIDSRLFIDPRLLRSSQVPDFAPAATLIDDQLNAVLLFLQVRSELVMRHGERGSEIGPCVTKLAASKRVALDIKAPQAGRRGFTPIAPLYTIEHAFTKLGRWRRLSRCYERSEASARAWLEVASVGYLAWRAVA